MNIGWNNREIIIPKKPQLLEENTLIEESIAKTLKPVMTRLKKMNVGVPYRDSRLFFFQFLKDKHPDLIPQDWPQTRKPAAKDVNAMVGQIAIDNPDKLDKISTEFEKYAKEDVQGTDGDRVAQFLNTAASLRHDKGVRPKAGEGFVKKDLSKLKAKDIAATTYDAPVKQKKETGKEDDYKDIKDEKLMLRAAIGTVLQRIRGDGEINPEAVTNVEDAIKKIDTVAEMERFIAYLKPMEEYWEIANYLEDALDPIETNLGDMGTENEEGTPANNLADERIDPREGLDEPGAATDEIPALEYLLDSPDFQQVKNGRDLLEFPELFDALFSHFQHEMPYGVQKARDGDPDQWIMNKLEEMGELNHKPSEQECVRHNESVKLSPQAVNQQLQEGYRQRMQNNRVVDQRYAGTGRYMR
jgi:5'-deoxynucleotidase YfbR-like HD superfamily hydrolase